MVVTAIGILFKQIFLQTFAATSMVADRKVKLLDFSWYD